MGYELLVKGATVDFIVEAPEILGSGFTNARINAELDMESAAAMGLDVRSMHRNMYALFKDKGYPDDPASYGYIRVTKENGIVTMLGVPWIKESSVVSKARDRITVDISDVSVNDLALVRAALGSNGFPQAVVKMAD